MTLQRLVCAWFSIEYVPFSELSLFFGTEFKMHVNHTNNQWKNTKILSICIFLFRIYFIQIMLSDYIFIQCIFIYFYVWIGNLRRSIFYEYTFPSHAPWAEIQTSSRYFEYIYIFVRLDEAFNLT